MRRMRGMRAVSRGPAMLAAAVLALAACSGGSSTTNTAGSTAVQAPAARVLAIGGSATEGDGVADRLHDAWPYVVFRRAFPRSTVFVNGALDGATAAHALADQAPLAAELKPTLVEVWLGADDVQARTPIPEFTASFTALVGALRGDGSTRVLVADLPPAYGAAAVPYNDAIRSVVARTHAELVPLAAAAVHLAPTGGLAPQPDAASHRAVATAFTRAIAARG
jgi:lysophospholipase L1-like esterase